MCLVMQRGIRHGAGGTILLTGGHGGLSTGTNIMVIITIGIIIIMVIIVAGNITAILHGGLIIIDLGIEPGLCMYKQDISVAIIEKRIQGRNSPGMVQNSLEKIFQKLHP